MPPSKLDSIYRKMLITRFFEKGWGTPENLQRLFEFRKIISKRETCYKLIPKDYPVEITKNAKYSDCTILEGKFLSPFELYLPGIVPKSAREAHFQVILPKKWTDERHKPMCIHLAGTGDHFYWRRRNFIAKPLLKEANIGAILLENPFYGLRKPEYQVRSNLQNVSDIFVMGGCLILECLVLLHWCERNGLGPLGVTGLSMGGHMASLAATNWPKPLVLVPCLSWSTAAAVFTTGVMSHSINWDMLETQFYSDGKYSERLSKMVTVIDDAFMAGQNFIQHFNQSIKELQRDINDATPTMSDDVVSDAGSIFKHPFTKKTGNTPLKGDTLKLYQPDVVFDNTTSLISSDKAVTPGTSNNAVTKLMKLILPNSAERPAPSIDTTKVQWWEREALQFMRGMMDECTHLKNFSVPYNTSLIIAVCAKDDAYVPREGCSSLEDIWPGLEVRYLDAGHVSAYVLHQKLFRSCIIEAFERAKKLRQEQPDICEDLQPLTYEDLMQKCSNSA